jgi:hypothetical protein
MMTGRITYVGPPALRGLGQYDVPPGYIQSTDPQTGAFTLIPQGPHGTSTISFGDPSAPNTIDLGGAGGGGGTGTGSGAGGGGSSGAGSGFSLFPGSGGGSGISLFPGGSASAGGILPGGCDPNSLFGSVFGCSITNIWWLVGGVVLVLLLVSGGGRHR